MVIALARAMSIAVVAASTLPAIGGEGKALVSIVLDAPHENSLVVAVDIVGFSAMRGHVTLSVERRGPAGRATIQQAQDVQLEPGVSLRATTLSVSFAPGDSLSAVATLSVGGNTISTATIETGLPEAAGSGGSE